MGKEKTLTEVLPIGSKLMVSLIARSSDGGEYDSVVSNVDAKSIDIAIPTRKGVALRLYKGTELLISTYISTGRLTFVASVEGLTRAHNTLKLNVPKDWKLEQSRQYFRISTHFKVKIFHGGLGDLEAIPKSEWILRFAPATVEDLSGGGCRISTDVNIQSRDRIIIDFKNSALEGLEFVHASAIRVDMLDSLRRSVNLRFVNIDEPMRNHVIRYVFRRELELKKMS